MTIENQDSSDGRIHTGNEKYVLKNESTSYDFLEKLKIETFPGLFTNKDEIKQYLLLENDNVTKHRSVYDEVRYAKMTYMSLKQTAAVFRLKRNHKNLTTDDYAENCIHEQCTLL